MDRLAHKKYNQQRRTQRVRSSIKSTTNRPRLSVFMSNIHVSAQIIDDNKHTTLVYVTTVGKKDSGSMSQKAEWVGNEVAKKAKQANIKKVVFDRGKKLYHGRIKVLAEAARSGGLEF